MFAASASPSAVYRFDVAIFGLIYRFDVAHPQEVLHIGPGGTNRDYLNPSESAQSSSLTCRSDVQWP
jgi:hypothetical protein